MATRPKWMPPTEQAADALERSMGRLQAQSTEVRLMRMGIERTAMEPWSGKPLVRINVTYSTWFKAAYGQLISEANGAKVEFVIQFPPETTEAEALQIAEVYMDLLNIVRY